MTGWGVGWMQWLGGTTRVLQLIVLAMSGPLREPHVLPNLDLEHAD
jgi:hypothetical protein